MSRELAVAPEGTAAPAGFTRPGVVRLGAVIAVVMILAAAAMLSLSVGSKPMSIQRAWDVLFHPDGSWASTAVHGHRIPRTVLGIVVGASLGVAGALMQSLTRNPLADPGVLGINAGASLAVVLAVAITGQASITFYMWFAFLGAALASVAVYALGTAGHRTSTPVRLALAGVAVSAALQSLTTTVILRDQVAFNEFRYWVAGSMEGRGWNIFASVVGFMAVGLVVAVLLAPSLNALALGEDTGRALGVSVERTRLGCIIAITLLCGAATAAVGPLGFVGLAVPFAARLLVGSDQRWVTGFSMILGAAWLLIADVLSRVLVRPDEVEVGIIAALIGAPFFVAIVRRRKIAAL